MRNYVGVCLGGPFSEGLEGVSPHSVVWAGVGWAGHGPFSQLWAGQNKLRTKGNWSLCFAAGLGSFSPAL